VQHVDILGDDPAYQPFGFEIRANCVNDGGTALIKGVDEIPGVFIIKSRIASELIQTKDTVGVEMSVNTLRPAKIRFG